MAIVVALHEKEYLVDVGFGEFTLHPLEMIAKPSIHDPIATFRMQPNGEEYGLFTNFERSGFRSISSRPKSGVSPILKR